MAHFLNACDSSVEVIKAITAVATWNGVGFDGDGQTQVNILEKL
jgi:hypothetical protein